MMKAGVLPRCNDSFGACACPWTPPLRRSRGFAALFHSSPRPSSRRLRVGYAVNLFTIPVVHGIESLKEKADLSKYSPAALYPALQRGDLDVALIPSHQALLESDCLVIPEVGVGCFGEGRLAMLCSKTLPTEIQYVRIDENAQPFDSLLEALLPRQLMIRPKLMMSDGILDPLSYDFYRDPCQAFLFTGVQALHAPAADFAWSWDIAQGWQKHSRMPFVAYVWAVAPRAHPLVKATDLGAAFCSLVKSNMGRIGHIAIEYEKQIGLPKDTLEQIYSKVLQFHLESAHVIGLRHFAKELSDAGPEPRRAELRLISSITTT